MSGKPKPVLVNSNPEKIPGIRHVSDEKLCRAMINSIVDYAVILTDPLGNIISLNKGAELILGYKNADVSGKSIAIFYPDKNLAGDGPAENLQEALVNNNYQIKGKRLKKDGSSFLANIHYSALYDDNHELLGYTKIIYELDTNKLSTEKVKIQHDSAASNISFRKLIENSYSGISLLDKKFEIIYRSHSAEKIAGWSAADRAERSMNDLIHPDDVSVVNEVLNSVIKCPGVPKQITMRSKHYGGYYIWLDCVFTNFLDEPNVNAIVCNFIDVSEKRKAEDILKEINKELAAFKHALDESAIVAITDQKGIIKHVNNNFCKISKYTEHELIGQDHRIINSSYHSKEFIRNLWTTIANGEIWKGELKNKAKDGSFYWVDTTIVPFLDIKGKPYQYMAIRSDITERKLNQQRIAESEKFIKTITDNLPALIAYWDANLQCLFANKPYAQFFKKTTEEILGINKKELMSPAELNEFKPYIKGVLSGEAQSFERNFAKSGDELVFTHTQYIPDIVNGMVKGFYSLIYDTTDIKLAEREIRSKTEQIKDLLENITDGFIALDDNLCYTYANKQIGNFLGIPAEALIGRHIWDVFPDAVGTATYMAIQQGFKQRVYVANEEYHDALKLWSENRVYPSETGISVFIRDITKRKKEEHHLKLLESVITNTTDAIMITEAEPQSEPGPRILYVNDAFTKLTGYTIEEVAGKTPRILQGPKSDRAELSRMKNAMLNWQSCEISTINYKKNGEEFWMNFSINPVADENGWFTHWIAIERDITERKKEEKQQRFLAEISGVFNETLDLKQILSKVLVKLIEFENLVLAEIWLVSPDKRTCNLSVKHDQTEVMASFYKECGVVKNVVKGEGLPGKVWDTGEVYHFNNINRAENLLRKTAALKAGIKSAYGIPIVFKNETIGVLVLGLPTELSIDTSLFERSCSHLGSEIRRKQLEYVLGQVFNLAPDVICIAGIDGYFKTINPAILSVLGYTELEMLNRPILEFVSADDQETAKEQFQQIINHQAAPYFECRFIRNDGTIRWLAWTITAPSEDGLIFCVAKDITERKELENLLKRANSLARIGGWEIDLKKGSVYWSDITKEIHEVDHAFVPDLDAGLSFYKEGDDRNVISGKVKNAIETGEAWDVELQIITAKGNIKWIRVIGEAEIKKGKCLRIYGSFQDINARKTAEISVTEVLKDRNTILESIGDAFFAVDNSWTVTYWNNMAEKVLLLPKSEILNRNLWDVFSKSVNSTSFLKYHEAVRKQQAMHFEDYHEPLKKWYEISAYPSDTGLSVYFKDVTDRKISDIKLNELNESLQLQTKELAASNAELEQFAYVASHDLQEPLRMITGFLSQIERKYNPLLDDKGRQYINFAVDGAKRMRQIILDLLEFSKVGSTEESLEAINVEQIINEVSALYRKKIEEKHASILFEHLPLIRTYKTPIRQVLQNLISNSLKYCKKDANVIINIGVIEYNTHWQFSVKDNGIGVEHEYFDKIFVIFQRLHHKDEYSGTGMGLAISKKIIEHLGGSIWVESNLGEGTTFYFTILKPQI